MLLLDEEVLALKKVKVGQNHRLTHICFDRGVFGVGNSNTAPYAGEKNYYSPSFFEGEDIRERQHGIKIAAIVDDVLYVIQNGEVKRLKVDQWCGGSREIAYDTREGFYVGPVCLQEETIELPQGTYTGYLEMGRPEGEGRITYPKDDEMGRVSCHAVFEGGKVKRNCEILFQDGGKYCGKTVGELPGGEGEYTFPSGEVLKGDFYGFPYGGKINGRGFLYDAEGKLLGSVQCKNGEILRGKED